MLCMGPSGLIALLAGWITTEVGRQPWVVYGLQRTKDAVSAHGVVHMSITLIAFVVIYCSVFGVGYGYMMRLIKKGPQEHEGEHHEDGGPGKQRTPARPLSAVDEKLS
jgi:cytochrome d ubiquinol oxidase subunit I